MATPAHKYQLTIVVPVYNEEESLDQFHLVMESYLQKTPIASTIPEDFLDYFVHLDAFDMVNGIRRQRADRLGKRLSSRIANAFRRALINDGIQDTCCPLKIMRASMAKQMPFFKGMHRFMPALIQSTTTRRAGGLRMPP